ncbi:MAG: HAMP domain-containing protein [Myxococcales bacterium]|nr:HAMP domain-containing protein [Myxococcales bacterium]
MAGGGSHGTGERRAAGGRGGDLRSREGAPAAGWTGTSYRGLGLRPQIVLSLAVLMGAILGLLALGIHVLVPVGVRREVSAARLAMVEVMARDLARRHHDPASARGALREALAAPAVDGVAVWDRDAGLVAAGAPPGARPFPGGWGPSFHAARREPEGTATVVFAASPDRAGSAAVRVHAGVAGDSLRSLEALLLGYLGLTALAVVVFGYISLTRLIVRPLDRLTRAARRLGSGREVEPVAAAGGREIVELTETFNAMTREVVGQRRELEEQVARLERLNRELALAQEQVVRSAKLASVGRLAAGVAHEIGNPLTVMLGFFDVLETIEPMAPAAREHLRTMRQEAERVNRTIRDLLDYARANPEPVEALAVGEVIDGTVGLLAPQKPFRAIEIQVTVPSDLPPVRANRDRLRQVLVNLLLNAADAIGPERAGTIELRAEPAALADGRSAVRIRVTDNGPGIPPELLGAIFDPFVTTKSPGAGTGLGLSVCEGIVEGLGGTIRASNRPEGGACFEVVLPAAD